MGGNVRGDVKVRTIGKWDRVADGPKGPNTVDVWEYGCLWVKFPSGAFYCPAQDKPRQRLNTTDKVREVVEGRTITKWDRVEDGTNGPYTIDVGQQDVSTGDFYSPAQEEPNLRLNETHTRIQMVCNKAKRVVQII